MGATVVFGGSGFIGTHLIRRLRAECGDPVVSVDIKPQRETLSGVEYRIADVRDLARFDVAGPIDRIYNLAAVHTTPGHPNHEYYETNILGALEVTQFAARREVGEVIFTSSIAVYGPGEETKSEDTPPAPASAYGYSKLIAERVHRQWRDRMPGRRLVIVRPAVVFGAGEGGNFTRLATLLKKGVFVYPGRKDTIKACIHVDDLIEAVELARNDPEDFVLFNAAYPQRYTLEQIVSTLIDRHFPGARTVRVSRSVVLWAARILRPLGLLKIGIHPDRIMKLVQSTDIRPSWLLAHGRDYPNAIERAFERWAEQSGGRFT